MFWTLTYQSNKIMNIRSKVWGILVDLYPCYLRWRYGMDIGRNCRISWKAHLDKSINPKGIHIGDNTWVLSGAMILAHDHCRSLKTDTYIGKNCVIGVRSIVLPGLSIGNQVVIGGVAWLQKVFIRIVLQPEILQKY
jgi:putative acetyltransferase